MYKLHSGLKIVVINERKNSSLNHKIYTLTEEMNTLRASHNKSYKDIIGRLEALEKFYELHRTKIEEQEKFMVKNDSFATLKSNDSFASASESFQDLTVERFSNCSDNGLEFELNSGCAHTSKDPDSELSLQEICEKSDVLHNGNDDDHENLFTLMQNYERLFDGSAEFLWRFARSHISVFDSRNKEEKHQLAATAVKACELALKLNSKDFNVYKWLAISLGQLTTFLPTKDKIETGFLVKKYIDKAIEINSNDATMHYTKGRWCYGVCQLTWIERKLAATLFATPPSASISDALLAFKTAEEIAPKTNKSNLFYLAKCEYEMKNPYAAVHALNMAIDLPMNSRDDRETHQQCEHLLLKLNKYTRT